MLTFRLIVVCVDGMITCELWWFSVELYEFLLFSLKRHGSDWTLRGWVTGRCVGGYQVNLFRAVGYSWSARKLVFGA